MKQKGIAKKISACFLCLAMVLTTVNLPMFTVGANAEDGPAESEVTFTYVEGAPTGFSTRENPEKALDGDTSTKWCAKFSSTAYIILQASDTVLPTGYSITTGSDTGYFTGRNPKKWTLYASNNYDSETKTGDWTVIDAIEDGNLPAKNLERVDFGINDCNDDYQYYKWEIEQIVSGDIVQVSEFTLSYNICNHSYVKTGEKIESTCVERGYDIEECSSCHTKRKVANDQPLKEHNMVDGICSVCGYNINPAVTVYATKADLVNPDNFTLHKDNGNGIAQKVNFGNGKTWYIAGAQHNCDDENCTDKTPNELVLMCNPTNPISTMQFSSDSSTKTYDGVSDWGTYETPLVYDDAGTNSSQVNANHYGASKLRVYINGSLLSKIFTSAEQSLMKKPTVYTLDSFNNDGNVVYSTADKLYLAYGDYDYHDGKDRYITVGTNSNNASDLNNGIKISLIGENGSDGSPYSSSNGIFYLRAPLTTGAGYVLSATTGSRVGNCFVDGSSNVVPAFHLDLSSVLFATAATTSSEDAELTDTMNFRMDGTDKIKSRVVTCTGNLELFKGEADTEYLYVLGMDNETSWVYAKQIINDELVTAEDIKAEKALSDIDLNKCKIWIETTEDNVTYAKRINITGKHELTSIESLDEKEHKVKCVNCDYYIREAHDFNIIELEENQYGKKCSICHEVFLADLHNFEGQPCTPADEKGKHIQSCKDEDCSEILISDCTPGAAVEENQIAATCGKDGSYELVTYCTECEQEIKREHKVIKATGEHEFGTYVSDENATCTEDGTKTATCSICGEKDVQEETGSKLGHAYSNHKYVDSKYHTEECSRCGVTNDNQELHDFSTYVSDNNATCTKNGTRTATCPTCGGKDVQEEPDTKLGHKYTSYTYVNSKYHEAVCSRCGYNNLEPHDFSEDATTCRLCKDSYETKEELSNTYYISKSDFEKKDFNDIYNLVDGQVVKVKFGSHTELGDGVGEKTSQVWYIAGKNDDGTLVLFCDPAMPMKKDQLFNNFDSATYNGYEVYPNHYGASIIRAYLTGDALNNFSTAEKALMADTSFYTYDVKNGTNYRLSDKLYIYGTFGVGNSTINSKGDIVSELVIDLKRGIQAPGRKFWSRIPTYDKDYEYIVVDGTNALPVFDVENYSDVVPACHLDLSSVFFASAASPVSSGTTLAEVMTFRMDGTGKVASEAVFDKDGIKVTKKADDEYIYIQYKVGDEDKVWSKAITGDMNIYKECIGVDSFANCKIWIEKKDDTDNLIYAVMATSGSSDIADHAYAVDSDNIKEHICSICRFIDIHDFINREIHEIDSTKETCSLCNVKNIAYEGLTITTADETYDGTIKTASITGISEDEFDVTDNNMQTDAGTYEITLTGKNGYAGIRIVSWTINKGNPEYTVPTDLTATYADTLADVTLPTAENGTWTWKDATTSVGSVGNNTFVAVFTPNDTNNYEVKEEDVSIAVAKATTSITIKEYAPGKTYDGEAIVNPTEAQLDITGANYSDVIFTWYKDSVEEANKITGTPENAGDYVLVASIAETKNTTASSDTSSVITITKANPTYTVPTVTAKCGDMLSTVTLPDGFEWTSEDVALEAGADKAAGQSIAKIAKYVPEDKTNYNDVEDIEISIAVTHALSATSNGDNTHSEMCNFCSYEAESVACSGGEATCTSKAVCLVCEEEYGELEPDNHSLVLVPSKDASCTEAGNKEYYECSSCHNYFENEAATTPITDKTSVVIAALGHTEEALKAVAPTCTKTGLTEGKKCSVCDKILVKQENVKALGHNEVIDKAVAPTCTKTGLTEGSHCSRCKKVIKAQTKVKALGHKWDGGVVTKEPTYTTEGIKTYTCTVCKTTKTETIAKKSAPKKGETVIDDKKTGNYIVTDTSKMEVAFKTPYDSKAKTVNIPETIAVGGLTYKVVKINDNAFKNNKYITTVKIGNNVTVIGKYAFYGCTKLNKLTVGKKVKQLDNYAFAKCSVLKKISLPAATVKFGSNVFNGSKKLTEIKIASKKLNAKNINAKAFAGIGSKVVIKVPKTCVKTYKKLFVKKGLSAKSKIVGF